MCLTLPARVITVDGDIVVVDLSGRERRASALLVDGLEPGDWVFVTAGSVVERLDPREAATIAAAVRQACGGSPEPGRNDT